MPSRGAYSHRAAPRRGSSGARPGPPARARIGSYRGGRASPWQKSQTGRAGAGQGAGGGDALQVGVQPRGGGRGRVRRGAGGVRRAGGGRLVQRGKVESPAEVAVRAGVVGGLLEVVRRRGGDGHLPPRG